MERYSIRSVIKKIILILIITVTLYLIIFNLSSYPISKLYSYINIILLASIPIIFAFIFKGLRFHVILRRFGVKYSRGITKDVILRFSSELFSLLGVSFLGDEAFRAYILNRDGMPAGKALWLSYIEAFEEVIVSTSIIILGSILSIISGEFGEAILIGVIVASGILIINILVTFSTESMINNLDRILKNTLGRVSTNLYNKISDTIRTHARELYKARDVFLEDRYALGITLLISYIIALLSGSSLYIISNSLSIRIDLMFSIFIVYLTLAVSSLPITLGGAGLTEIYLLYVGTDISGNIPWFLPIVYRLSTYFIPLLAALIAFIIIIKLYRL